MRWLLGGGPQYCAKACDEHRAGVPTCNDCARPRLLPENVAAANLFLRCQTQWLYRPDGKVQGLNYASVVAVMQARQAPDQGELLERVRFIEAQALEFIHGGESSDDGDAN